MESRLEKDPDEARHLAGGAEDHRRAPLAAPDVDLERVWMGVAARVWAREVGWVERLAGQLLGSPGMARALVATPSLLPAWILATTIVLAVGVIFTWNTGTPWVALLAPAMAGAGIAYAYGPGIDPAFELSRSLPISDHTILLVRSLAVFGLNALFGLVASLFTGAVGPLTFSWLIPMTTVCALALAAAVLARSANVGVTAALVGWAFVVLAGRVFTNEWGAAVTEASLIPFYLAGGLILAVIALHASRGNREERILWQ